MWEYVRTHLGVLMPFRFGSRRGLRPWVGITHLNPRQEVFEQWDPVIGIWTYAGSETTRVEERLFGVAIEGGWRYRNWDYGNSPGVYEGPYLRLGFSW